MAKQQTQQLAKQPERQVTQYQDPQQRQKACIRELGRFLQKHKDRILEGLPAGIDGTALIKKAVFEIQRAPHLLDCDPYSLFQGIYEAAVNGLEIGGVRDEAYLVPYGGVVQMQPGYKGLIALVRRTGQLQEVVTEIVRQGDQFHFTKGDAPKLVHVPSDLPNRETLPAVAYYVIFVLKDNTKVRGCWTAAEIAAHRNAYSKAWNKGERYIAECARKKVPPDPQKLSPWHSKPDKMAFKTIIHDVINSGKLPMQEAKCDILLREAPERKTDAYDSFINTLIGSDAAEPAQLTTVDPGEIPLDPKPEEAQAAAEPITGEAWLESLKVELGGATNLGEVTAIREKWDHELSGDELAQADAQILCNQREELIRAGRSEQLAQREEKAAT